MLVWHIQFESNIWYNNSVNNNPMHQYIDIEVWGPQTERSRNNFPTGQYMPLAIIRALLNIKKLHQKVNSES